METGPLSTETQREAFGTKAVTRGNVNPVLQTTDLGGSVRDLLLSERETRMARIINKDECINCEAVCPVSCISEA